MREQRRIIAHLEQQLRLVDTQLPAEPDELLERSVCCDDSLQPANSFYHQLCSVAVRAFLLADG